MDAEEDGRDFEVYKEYYNSKVQEGVGGGDDVCLFVEDEEDCGSYARFCGAKMGRKIIICGS